MQWTVPLFDVDYTEDEVQAVADVVRSRRLLDGPHTAAFEDEVRAFLECDHAILVNTGSAALHLALRALDVGVRSQVLLPAISHVMAAHAVLMCGAEPVFVDILHPENPTMDAEDAFTKATHHTRAVIPLHYAGFACQLSALKSLRAAPETGEERTNGGDESRAPRERQPRERRPRGRAAHEHDTDQDERPIVPLIENAGHAIGGRDPSGTALGAAGRLGCFNFFINKQMTTGSGGLIVTNDQALADQIRLMRSQGITPPPAHAPAAQANSARTPSSTTAQQGFAGYDVACLGYDYRPTEITAALARVQLKKLPAMIERRAALFALYHELLADVEELVLPFHNPQNWGRPACLFLPVLCSGPEARAELAGALGEAGIQTDVHYRPIHTLRYFSSIVIKHKPALPQSEAFARRVLSLPLHSRMTEHDVYFVVKTIKEALVRA
ncbi:MAG: DegT/DnrJ/EryC1/StrS family aminotransferase [Candidatus Sumerlaeia bacterium]